MVFKYININWIGNVFKVFVVGKNMFCVLYSNIVFVYMNSEIYLIQVLVMLMQQFSCGLVLQVLVKRNLVV